MIHIFTHQPCAMAWLDLAMPLYSICVQFIIYNLYVPSAYQLNWPIVLRRTLTSLYELWITFEIPIPFAIDRWFSSALSALACWIGVITAVCFVSSSFNCVLVFCVVFVVASMPPPPPPPPLHCRLSSSVNRCQQSHGQRCKSEFSSAAFFFLKRRPIIDPKTKVNDRDFWRSIKIASDHRRLHCAVLCLLCWFGRYVRCQRWFNAWLVRDFDCFLLSYERQWLGFAAKSSYSRYLLSASAFASQYGWEANTKRDREIETDKETARDIQIKAS